MNTHSLTRTHTDCMPLTNPTNGNIVYDNDFAIGSVATYTCNTGYGVQGGPTRTCAADGWNDANITCGERSAVQSSHFSYKVEKEGVCWYNIVSA